MPQRSKPVRLESKVLLAPAASLIRRLSNERRDKALRLQPVERFVDGTERDRPPGARVDLLPDRHAVRVVAEANERQEDELFEITKGRNVRHEFVRRCLTKRGSVSESA